MLVGRCSWELSGRKLQRKIQKSQTPSVPEGSAVPRTSPANAKYYAQTKLSSRPERGGFACTSLNEIFSSTSIRARQW
jgi:hypothetical protein